MLCCCVIRNMNDKEWRSNLCVYIYSYYDDDIYERIRSRVRTCLRNSKDEYLHERISDLFRNEIKIVPERNPNM